MTVKIDKNVPYPPAGKKLPFDQMEIGDSFLVPAGISHHYTRQLIHVAQKRLAWKFSLRRTREGYRCWRVDPQD